MIFGKRSAGPGSPEHDSVHTRSGTSQLTGEGLEAEYEDIVRAQIARLGVPLESVTVEVRMAGAMPDGRSIYLGMVRLAQWQPRSSLRLLVALPFLENKTRQSLETSWLSDVSHFGGLWVHASSASRGNDVLAEIRQAIVRLEVSGHAAQPGAGWSSSVQAALEEPDPTRR